MTVPTKSAETDEIHVFYVTEIERNSDGSIVTNHEAEAVVESTDDSERDDEGKHRAKTSQRMQYYRQFATVEPPPLRTPLGKIIIPSALNPKYDRSGLYIDIACPTDASETTGAQELFSAEWGKEPDPLSGRVTYTIKDFLVAASSSKHGLVFDPLV